jgi:ankyrin repeat domain-containing protein 50
MIVVAGAGKTVLSYASCISLVSKDSCSEHSLDRSILINFAEEGAREPGSSTCIGFIYLRYSDKVGLTVRSCLEVLVKQSLEQHPGFDRLVAAVYVPHLRLETEPTEEEILQLLKQFVGVVLSTSYFLDALDEAPAEIRIPLVEKLLSTGAKLFVTSRPMKALEDHFPNAHHFSIVAQDADLDLLINSNLELREELRRVLQQGGPELRAEIVMSIKKKCGGM